MVTRSGRRLYSHLNRISPVQKGTPSPSPYLPIFIPQEIRKGGGKGVGGLKENSGRWDSPRIAYKCQTPAAKGFFRTFHFCDRFLFCPTSLVALLFNTTLNSDIAHLHIWFLFFFIPFCPFLFYYYLLFRSID